jgi:hypothetical protein
MNFAKPATLAEIKQYVIERLEAADINGLLPQNMPDDILGGFGHCEPEQNPAEVPEDVMEVLTMICVPIMVAATGNPQVVCSTEEMYENITALWMWYLLVHLTRCGLVDVAPPTLQNIFDKNHVLKMEVLRPDFMAPPSAN